jgi:hypothetical protein
MWTLHFLNFNIFYEKIGYYEGKIVVSLHYNLSK